MSKTWEHLLTLRNFRKLKFTEAYHTCAGLSSDGGPESRRHEKEINVAQGRNDS